MARLQDLTIGQINKALEAAVDKQVPLTVTVRDGSQWTTLHSRFHRLDQQRVLIHQPVSTFDAAPREFAPSDKLGISFKLKHYKHLASFVVAGQQQDPGLDGQPTTLLSLVSPNRMQRAQRRVYLRVDVPDNCIVRASFWHGGADGEPSKPTEAQPVWRGEVQNLSAGGILVRCPAAVLDSVDVGDMVGMHVTFGPGQESVTVDAQFRHVEGDDDQLLLGFQFLGLEATDDGKTTLLTISRRVNEIRDAASRIERARSRRSAG